MFFLLGIFYWATAYACGDARDSLKSEKKPVNTADLNKNKLFSISKKETAKRPEIHERKAQ